MCWAADINWAGLEDQFNAVENRREGLESHCESLCQEPWDEGRFVGAWRDQSFSNGGCHPLPIPTLDAIGRQAVTGITSNPEPNRK